jgi:hypothetical protein
MALDHRLHMPSKGVGLVAATPPNAKHAVAKFFGISSLCHHTSGQAGELLNASVLE